MTHAVPIDDARTIRPFSGPPRGLPGEGPPNAVLPSSLPCRIPRPRTPATRGGEITRNREGGDIVMACCAKKTAKKATKKVAAKKPAKKVAKKKK